jgi:hypothetical protein
MSTKEVKIMFLEQFKSNRTYANLESFRNAIKELREEKNSEVRNFALSLSYLMNVN